MVVADERTLLAMKMRVSRGRRDEVDIQFLLHKCGIATVDDALGLYEEYSPEDELPDRAVPMLRHALEQLRMEQLHQSVRPQLGTMRTLTPRTWRFGSSRLPGSVRIGLEFAVPPANGACT